MTRGTVTERLKRMELLAAQLKQEGHCRVRDLAEQYGVSVRTITRDLAIMRDQGMPIDAERGRGGGVRLDANWGVGRMNLSYAEAVDLLISISVAEHMKSPLFLTNLSAVRRQLVASFSPKKRAKVDALKSRILVGTTSSAFVQMSQNPSPERVVRGVQQAFVEQEILLAQYKREDGETSEREIEPHYLLLKYPAWYVIGMDRLRGAARTFRCDRFLSARPTGETFRRLPKEAFDQALREDDLAILQNVAREG